MTRLRDQDNKLLNWKRTSQGHKPANNNHRQTSSIQLLFSENVESQETSGTERELDKGTTSAMIVRVLLAFVDMSG